MSATGAPAMSRSDTAGLLCSAPAWAEHGRSTGRAAFPPHGPHFAIAPREVSAELLGQSDDDALGATQEAEPVAVLVLRDLADEFGTVAAQAGNDIVDVVDS